MKKYRVIFIQHNNNLFRSNEKMKEEIVEAETFKQAREIIRNKYKDKNISNITVEELKEV
jgi:hypothetical protein